MNPQPDNRPPETAKPRAHYRAKGKIASLPKHQREALNLLLLDGSTYSIVIQKMAQRVRRQPAAESRHHEPENLPAPFAEKLACRRRLAYIRKMNRRQFLKQGSAAVIALSAVSYVPTTFAAEKTRRVGLIGAGWYGKSDLWRLVQVTPGEIVSICDPDKHMLAEAVEIAGQRVKSAKPPRTYNDYREMLKEKDLDIVLVGSPDHWHALHAIAAMEAGADVYCQNPISRDVREGEAMLDAARRLNPAGPIGTQRKSTPHLLEAKRQFLEGGRLGKIGHVEMCCYFHMRANGNPPLEPVPDSLDYEMWK